MSRPGRPLGREERLLWEAVARSVRPLAGAMASRALDRTLPSEPAEPAPPAAPLAVPSASFGRPAPSLRVPAPAVPPPRPPSAPLDRRTVRALARGRLAAEGVLDLHGLTQADAHAALVRFVHASHRAGRALVLVITGKGATGKGAPDPAASWPEGGRGILRRQVPLWLSLPDLRPLVIGFEEAGPRQGGAGALYVRVRRAVPGR